MSGTLMYNAATPLRICQIMLTAGFGGGERLFVDLCQAQADAGHRILAVCHPEFQGISELVHDRIEVTHLKVRIDWSPLAHQRFKKMLARFQTHVIHTHFARAASVAGGVGKALGVPVAANLHNYVNLKYYRKIDHFFPGTEDQKKYLRENGIIADRITVVPHFSRLPVREEERIIFSGEPCFCSFGRFVHKKGFHVLLKSIKILHDKGVPARLLLGGDGPEKENLKNQIADLGLEGHVTLCGWIRDVPEFLETSPFFVLPSLDEPFGIVMLEAMALGKVVLSTLSQGPSEVLDQETAYLFPVDDAAAMALAMQAAFEDGPQALDRAQKARRRYLQLYAPDKVLPQFEKVYTNLIR